MFPDLNYLFSLLETGEFSDAVVKCGQRSWKVHRAILCPRSKWFRAALAGHFRVSTESLPLSQSVFPGV
ncbi:hypothetical protein F4779DRAFT_573948 [Xylariaceae sp. FL0662B]|nr:hypothetical protein F4779DRAFT_573948 [Xylariaceae sp. FL0662B]